MKLYILGRHLKMSRMVINSLPGTETLLNIRASILDRNVMIDEQPLFLI